MSQRMRNHSPRESENQVQEIYIHPVYIHPWSTYVLQLRLRIRARDDALIDAMIFKKFSPDFPVYLRFVILAHILTSRKRFLRENLSKRIFKIFY